MFVHRKRERNVELRMKNVPVNSHTFIHSRELYCRLSSSFVRSRCSVPVWYVWVRSLTSIKLVTTFTIRSSQQFTLLFVFFSGSLCFTYVKMHFSSHRFSLTQASKQRDRDRDVLREKMVVCFFEWNKHRNVLFHCTNEMSFCWFVISNEVQIHGRCTCRFLCVC